MKEESTIEVLISTMNQSSHDLIKTMNIYSDAIVINQSMTDGVESFKFHHNNIKWVTQNLRGVGRSRNTALMEATADYLIFADDDMCFYSDYATKAIEVFNKYPNVDVFIFNLDDEDKINDRNNIKEFHYTKKIGYGAARIAIKRETILKKGIFFNLCFGGGTQHSCGEDTLFLRECVTKKCKMLCVPISLACLKNSRSSTWFNGYTDKYFFDKGYLLKATGIRFLYIRIFINAVKSSKETKVSFHKVYKNMISGVRSYNKQ